MNLLGWVKSRVVGPRAAGRIHPGSSGGRLVLRARYDAAQTTDNSRRHWSLADGLSARSANSPEVRRVLRNRSRYEVANNCYAKGLVLTLANDTIGTGPRLQMLSGNAQDNRLVEREFSRWTRACNLADKLRTMRMARCQDGEAFALLGSNPLLPVRVNLDLRLVEAEQVATPDFSRLALDQAVDGIVFDDFGNPVQYHLLAAHPGDLGQRILRYQSIPAAAILHDFRVDRPGQARGIPEITPALHLFAMLRDYSLATLDAAKAAAYFAGVLQTDAPANGEAESLEPLDSIELQRNMLVTLPGGWKLGQVDAQQPVSTYPDCKREIINEIARCLNVPQNVAAGNSSDYNYASGRLDQQLYGKAIRVDQSRLEVLVLDRILNAWTREAILIEGYLPQRLRTVDADWDHTWLWPGNPHVDPQKEAAAQETRLRNHTTTLAEEYARAGQDWEAQVQQRAKEVALMRELGLTDAQAAPATPVPQEETSDAPA